MAHGKTDWTKCFVCQIDGKCPKRSPEGCSSFAENLSAFLDNELTLPDSFEVNRINDGSGIQSTLTKNDARLHDKCRLKFTKQAIDRSVKRKLQMEDTCNNNTVSTKYTRHNSPSSTSQSQELQICIICNVEGGTIHKASTFAVDQTLRQYAEILNDGHLLGKLSQGDAIAIGASYHKSCMTKLHSKVRDKSVISKEGHTQAGSIALAELLSHIEDARGTKSNLKLSNLHKMYIERRLQLGDEKGLNATNLKNKLLEHIPDLQAIKPTGKDVYFIFEDQAAKAFESSLQQTDDDEAILLARAAKILRRQMDNQKTTFSGSFENGCQEQSVSDGLTRFVNMVLEGSDITSEHNVSQSCLSIAQLLQFNYFSKRRNGSSMKQRHFVEREPPLAVYLGVSTFARTRKREMVDCFHELGLSISYKRVQEISTKSSNALCKLFSDIGAVCPPPMAKGVFTTGAFDNIDHNTSSTSSKSSFHGTAISLFQHPDKNYEGEALPPVDYENAPQDAVLDLPEFYNDIPPISLRPGAKIPSVDGMVTGSLSTLKPAIEQEMEWLECVKENVDAEITEDSHVSWSSFHAFNQQPGGRKICQSALLPMFHEDSKSPAMVKHAMSMCKQSIHVLNPAQTPVITADQPLYALAKQIQWTWPETHGEDKYVVILGGMHIEQTVFRMIGNMLQGSGWTNSLYLADIASAGTADSMTKVCHLTRTRRAHQTTAASLYILQQQAYEFYKTCCSLDGLPYADFDKWAAKQQEMDGSPQFKYWSIILNLELLALSYIRSVREGDFPLYVDTLTALLPWMFALDHTNYSKWLPVHIRDMAQLKTQHPHIYEEFLNGKFTVQKSNRVFSSISIDQAHEQNNILVKGDGGAVGLLDNETALKKWMVGGPQLSRVIKEFESNLQLDPEAIFSHHEQTVPAQKAYMKDVKSLVSVIDDMGNPFLEPSDDLCTLDSKDVMDKSIAASLYTIENTGKECADRFMNERILEQTVPIEATVKRNNITFFSAPKGGQKSKSQLDMLNLKGECNLFSSLFIASQKRETDLDDFFKHENQSYPPSLSIHGSLRTPTAKSEILIPLEKLSTTATPNAPRVEAAILDGAVIVNLLVPKDAKTFDIYASNIFNPYIQQQLSQVRRLDIIWDRYLPNSLKLGTRQNRGKGKRRKVYPTTAIPGNWKEFLREDKNKTELFGLLAMSVGNIPIAPEKQLVTTLEQDVISCPPTDTSQIAPCTQEEADSRIFLHVQDAANKGYNSFMIRTIDTDVVILAIGFCSKLKKEIWIAFGRGKTYRFIPAHEIANSLGPVKSVCLPLFHALTGCDTVSSFYGHSKQAAMKIWNKYDDLTGALQSLMSTSESLSKDDPQMKIIQRFVILLYNPTSNLECINDARRDTFTQKTTDCERLPPTEDALFEHTKRAVLQGSFIWGQSHIRSPEIPSPEDWGWNANNGIWMPKWTELEQAGKVSQLLVKCACLKSNCGTNCGCRKKASFYCTERCACKGQCSNSQAGQSMAM